MLHTYFGLFFPPRHRCTVVGNPGGHWGVLGVLVKFYAQRLEQPTLKQ
jgi:hypothetical protein